MHTREIKAALRSTIEHVKEYMDAAVAGATFATLDMFVINDPLSCLSEEDSDDVVHLSGEHRNPWLGLARWAMDNVPMAQVQYEWTDIALTKYTTALEVFLRADDARDGAGRLVKGRPGKTVVALLMRYAEARLSLSDDPDARNWRDRDAKGYPSHLVLELERHTKMIRDALQVQGAS